MDDFIRFDVKCKLANMLADAALKHEWDKARMLRTLYQLATSSENVKIIEAYIESEVQNENISL